MRRTNGKPREGVEAAKQDRCARTSRYRAPTTGRLLQCGGLPVQPRRERTLQLVVGTYDTPSHATTRRCYVRGRSTQGGEARPVGAEQRAAARRATAAETRPSRRPWPALERDLDAARNTGPTQQPCLWLTKRGLTIRMTPSLQSAFCAARSGAQRGSAEAANNTWSYTG